MYPCVTKSEKVTVSEQLFGMSDGVRLYTRIVTPNGDGKFPIVFIRTPYEKAHGGVAHDIAEYDSNPFVDSGYAIVLQHCRGRGDSEGVCLPYDERNDGLDSLAIIRKLDIYNGEIYLYGGSYLSTVHLSYLDTAPEDVKGAVLNIQTDRMYFRNYRNGCCYNFCNLNWWLGMLNRAYPHQKLDGAIQRPYVDIMKRVIGTDYAPYTDLLLNDKYNAFWENDPRTYVIDNLKIPVLFTEGWYDFYIDGMFNMWERLPSETKARSAFIVGPWGHATSVSEQAEYPLKNGNIPADYVVEWFNSIRGGKPYPYARKGQVNYYSIGKDAWQTSSYPAALPAKRFYFAEEGRLSATPCKTEAQICYRYDPETPVTCYPYRNIYKAVEIGKTEGVTSFLSEEFDEDISFFGKVRWRMDVSSDCEDTAFFMRVYFVEEGVAYNLTETITSLSHIKEDYQAGEKMTVDIVTPPIAFTVKRGGRIRVDVSSNGGIYVPHGNVKGHWATITETRVAKNTLYLRDAFVELYTKQQDGVAAHG